MDELVTVIIPAYNIEQYIDDCLISVESQTYSELEIIVVNDGSTDDTDRIISKHKEKDGRIHVIDQENRGLVVARKVGLDKAKGKYCLFVDGDDWIDNDLIRFMVSKIDSGEYDAVHANYYEDYTDNSCICMNTKFEEVLELDCIENKTDILRKRFLANITDSYITPSIWARIYNTDFARILYSFIPDDQSYGEDVLFLMHLILAGKYILLTEKAFYHYRIIDNSLSHSYGVNNLASITKLYMNMIDLLKKYDVYDSLRNDVDGFYWEKLLQGIKKIERVPLMIGIYMFPDIELLTDRSIVLYGAGTVGKDYYLQLSCYENIRIIGWVDKKYNSIVKGYRIKKPDTVLYTNNYDYVVIAANDTHIAEEIRKELLGRGIQSNKIIWKKPLSAYDLMRDRL